MAHDRRSARRKKDRNPPQPATTVEKLREFLAEEGYRPTLEPGDALRFRLEGGNYRLRAFEPGAKDENGNRAADVPQGVILFRLEHLDFWHADDASRADDFHVAASEAHLRFPSVRLYLHGERACAVSEGFAGSCEAYLRTFPRRMATLHPAVRYVRRLLRAAAD